MCTTNLIRCVFVPLLECVQIVTMCVSLVPQAPFYTEDEAWTMYFKAEDAVWQAVFAKEDLEFVKYDREFNSSELRETNNRMTSGTSLEWR